MKAVASLVCTGVLPTARTHSTAVLTAASSVRIVRTTSTSFMSGTGLKKWRPSTCPGRRVAAAIAVTLHDEVLEARIARGGQTRSSLANVSFLSGWFSVIASTTRSQSWRSSSRVVPPMRPSASSFAFASILPRATSASSVVLRLPRPRWSKSSLASTTVVAKPAWAETCAMPDPMSPQPSTPTAAEVPRPSVTSAATRPARRKRTICRTGHILVIDDEGVKRIVLELVPAVEERQLDQKSHAHDVAAELLDESQRGRHRTARGEQIVDGEDALARPDGVLVHRQRVAAVLELVLDFDRLAGQLSELAHGDEAGPELM